MKQSFFIGVDGGGTKCIVRVEDEKGQVLGVESSGPANIRISVPQAWQSIHTALEKILNQHALTLDNPNYDWHVGMGLAGCEIHQAYQDFLKQAYPFSTLVISSDAHTACLGAHGGADGSIIIVGTGVVGFQVASGQTTKVSGWGFPHDDQGGGAWLGLEASKITLQSLDGRIPTSNLAKVIYAHFENNFDHLISWSNQANSTAFAELAPYVIEQCKAGDSVAIAIMQEAARAINRIAHALELNVHDVKECSQKADFQQACTQMKSSAKSRLPCSLVGGIAPFIEPYLEASLRDALSPCQSSADVGAIMLIRNYLAEAHMDDAECEGL